MFSLNYQALVDNSPSIQGLVLSRMHERLMDLPGIQTTYDDKVADIITFTDKLENDRFLGLVKSVDMSFAGRFLSCQLNDFRLLEHIFVQPDDERLILDPYCDFKSSRIRFSMDASFHCEEKKTWEYIGQLGYTFKVQLDSATEAPFLRYIYGDEWFVKYLHDNNRFQLCEDLFNVITCATDGPVGDFDEWQTEIVGRVPVSVIVNGLEFIYPGIRHQFDCLHKYFLQEWSVSNERYAKYRALSFIEDNKVLDSFFPTKFKHSLCSLF